MSIRGWFAAGWIDGEETLTWRTLDSDEELRRATARTTRDWDGTLLVRDHDGRSTLIREQVLPVHDLVGRPTGFHVSLWFPADQQPGTLPDHSAASANVAAMLTPRQLEIARLFASGMTAVQVASDADISWRTARAHLEEIYARLGVHSRAALALLLAQAGLL